jgi:cellulose synthase/poly-beta-1,6-N-acetylglucosamine synthase-like glycosyltransferase
VVDEVCIEWQIKNSGYKTIYVPESRLYIRTPDTIKDFILQRRRIATGHIWAEQILKYAPATRNIQLSLQTTFKQLSQNPGAIFFILAAILLEYFSRILGWYDYYIRRRNPYIWKICLSTKSKLVHF